LKLDFILKFEENVDVGLKIVTSIFRKLKHNTMK